MLIAFLPKIFAGSHGTNKLFRGYFQSMLVGIELMADTINGDMINFSKYSKHYKCICDILQGQLNPYKFKLVCICGVDYNQLHNVLATVPPTLLQFR